ncbi:hypothetical protein ACLM45_11755 [Synechococcus sp. A10-1-5-9]|uniref:hypothetical protein n=1 Tax=Synechococcus sp. A10-1-5-9 TaxID=3392295 RepID=UPI0039E7B081
MNDFFRGLGSVCLGSRAGAGAGAGAGLGAASFFAIEAVLPKQADAAPAHTVTKALKHETKLSARQTILEANRHLIANGWRPAPEKTPTPEERRLSSIALESLSVCSSTGVGFCRFDYRRDLQRLSVLTVPSEPGRPSVGRVDRCGEQGFNGCSRQQWGDFNCQICHWLVSLRVRFWKL